MFNRALQIVRTPDLLITRVGGLMLAGIAMAAAAWIAAQFVELHALVRLAIIIGSGIITCIIWLIGRGAYWRLGKGRRFAIAYEEIRVDPEDWRATKNRIHDLFKHRDIKEHLVLKLIPSSFASESNLDRTSKKYGFSCVCKVTSSGSTRDGTDAIEVKVAKYPFDSMPEELRHSILNCASLICPSRAESPSLPQLLDIKASTIADPLILFAAAIDYAAGEFNSAGPLFRHVDNRISNRFRVSDDPRATIRGLHSYCIANLSMYSNKNPPPEIILEQAIADCQQAIEEYSDEYPYYYSVQARNYFFQGHLEKAIETNECIPDNAEPDSLACKHLNKAVLSLLDGQYKNSTNSFQYFRSMDGFKYFKIDELIEFADCAFDMGHANAVFLQGFYRKIAYGNMDPDLESRVKTWLNEDGSRSGLQRLFFNSKTQSSVKTRKLKPRSQKVSKRSRRRRR